MALQIGETAPDFEAETTQGRIRFHDWLGSSWGVLFASQGLYAGLHDGTRLHGSDQAGV
jgi:alkyl hydroperoxide reductase subunit AhpC